MADNRRTPTDTDTELNTGSLTDSLPTPVVEEERRRGGEEEDDIPETPDSLQE